MKSNSVRKRSFVLTACVLSVFLAKADDYTFTNSAGSASFNAAGNWDLGSVPGMGDTARFTNSATYTVGFSAGVQNAKAVFDAAGGNVTLGITNCEWSLSDSLAVGPSTGANPNLFLTAGTLSVTNGGAGLLDIGTGGAGSFTIQGAVATANVDRITVTNVVNGSGNSFLNLRYGTLNSWAGSTVLMATNGSSTSGPNYGDFRVGPTNGSTAAMTWNILGGTHLVRVPGAGAETSPAFMIGGTAGSLRGIVNVSGEGTVLSNYGGGRLLVGAAHTWGSGGLNYSFNNRLNITGGAKVYNRESVLLIGFAANSNSVWVSGSNSLLSGRELHLAKSYENSELVVTNGGQVVFASGTSLLGEGQGGKGRIAVVGAGSSCFFGGGLGIQGNACEILIAEGGKFQTTVLYMNHSNKAGRNNRLVVSGSGSEFTNTGTTYVQLTSKYNPTTHSNVLFRVEQGGLATMSGELSVGGYDNNAPTNCVGAAAVVSDSGSTLLCRDVVLSKYLSDKTVNLVVSNAASVVSRHAYVGNEKVAAGNPAFAGEALVTDADSLWRLTGTLYVGHLSSGFLTVSNGGAVVATGCVAGNSATATGNVLRVNAASLTVTNSASTALLDIRDGTLLVANGGSVTADKLTFTNTVDALTLQAGPNGLGSVKVKGELKLLSGSKLKIDLTGYSLPYGQKSAVLKLVEYGTLPTPFSPSDIQLVNPKFGVSLTQGDGSGDAITLTVSSLGTTVLLN